MKVEIRNITFLYTDVTLKQSPHQYNLLSKYDIDYTLIIDSWHQLQGNIIIASSENLDNIETLILDKIKSAIQSNDSHSS